MSTRVVNEELSLGKLPLLIERHEEDLPLQRAIGF
jgi:hypothetical protein